jgi:predicted CoA-binding protein
MQQWAVNETAAKITKDSGMEVVVDGCMKIEHEKRKSERCLHSQRGIRGDI